MFLFFFYFLDFIFSTKNCSYTKEVNSFEYLVFFGAPSIAQNAKDDCHACFSFPYGVSKTILDSAAILYFCLVFLEVELSYSQFQLSSARHCMPHILTIYTGDEFSKG
uniref:Long chain acyl-CoA synthetase 1 n=1 Tax=Rhizophora mucronata TaxID=61149 RepID=A0A2P2MPA1_RHIMU